MVLRAFFWKRNRGVPGQVLPVSQVAQVEERKGYYSIIHGKTSRHCHYGAHHN